MRDTELIHYPGYNINQRSLLVNGRTQMNGNLTINGNISVNSTNIALGFQAGNIVNGDQSGLPNGTLTTAVGSYTGMNHTGTNNTFIGSIAGQASTTTYFSRTGSNNTYVGYAAQANGGTYSNSTAIGTGAIITATNQIVLGTTTEGINIPSGNVYIASGGFGKTINVGGIPNSTNIGSYSVPYAYFGPAAAGAHGGVIIGTINGNTPYIASSYDMVGNPLNLNFYTNNVNRMSIDTAGTVSIPGRLIQSASAHLEFLNTDNSVAYYNSAGTSISSGTTNTEMYYRFTNVRTNINWGTLSYLKNAGLYVPYTGIYFIQFDPGSYTTNKECFISKNEMINGDINSSNVLAVLAPNTAASLCCTTFLNASEFINLGSYSGTNGALSTRATFCITLIQRTA